MPGELSEILNMRLLIKGRIFYGEKGRSALVSRNV
jgi:hypothetical protein